MGLTILSFAAAAALATLLHFAWARARRVSAGRALVAMEAVFLAFAILEGSVSLIAQDGPSKAALAVSRMATVLMAYGSSLLLAFTLAFPRWAGAWARVAAWASAAAATVLSWFVVGTMGFMASVVGTSSGVVRVSGPRYNLLSDLIAGLAILAGVVQAVRAATTRDRIHRQRSLVSLIGILVGVLAMWTFVRLIPERSGIRWAYSLMPLAVLLIGGFQFWAFSLSRLFDWGQIGRTILAYSILALVFGVPIGGLVAFLVLMGRIWPAVTVIGALLAFLALRAGAASFAERRLAALAGRRAYREELESGLAHVDLAQGRDAVLEELHGLLETAFDFRDFSVLIEDDRGLLKTAFAPTGASATVARGSPLQEAIERSGLVVLVKSEAIADPAWEAVRPELLSLLEQLRAEALVFAREGRRIIGVFSFGARRSGGDYTWYDYETFKSIYGKLFVFAYYLKNVARESIVYTVDRELALSDQVIRFALEKVDPVKHPAADAAWVTRSTRSLGGDFVDFVRLSRDRWFFVMGDVSGKGLSASMNMLVLKSMIRTFLRVERDFSGLVQKVNAFIKDNLPRGTFFAGIFGYFDLAAGSVYFVNCGIPSMLLYSPSFDAFVEVQGEGKILGFVRDVAPFLKPRKLSLPPGSALVISTDGVIESESLRGERFGKERLRRSSGERLSLPAREIADGVVEDLMQFTDRRQEDDITLLVIKIKERSAR